MFANRLTSLSLQCGEEQSCETRSIQLEQLDYLVSSEAPAFNTMSLTNRCGMVISSSTIISSISCNQGSIDGYHTSNVHSLMSFSYPLTSYTSSVMSPEQGSCITWNDTKYIAQSGCHTGFQDKGEIRKNVAKKRSIQYPSYGYSVIQIVHECKCRRGISPSPPDSTSN